MYYRGRIMSTIPIPEDGGNDKYARLRRHYLWIESSTAYTGERPCKMFMFMFNFNRTDVKHLKRMVCAFGQILNVKFEKIFGASIFTPVPRSRNSKRGTEYKNTRILILRRIIPCEFFRETTYDTPRAVKRKTRG